VHSFKTKYVVNYCSGLHFIMA